MARLPVVEWPTFMLILGALLGWAMVVAFAGWTGHWIVLPLAAVLVTLHSSLQHEALHGHPTRSAAWNEALVYTPLGLFIPYRRFKALHLRHHNNDRLTDPYDDPESFYLALADWQRLPGVVRAVLTVNNTLLGRLVIGPLVALIGFYGTDLRALLKGDRKVANAWLHHALGLVPVVVFVTFLAGVPLWLYAAAVAYPAMSLLMLRTFAEHRAHADPEKRSIIVEHCPVFSLLFLNNNLHLVHHSHPAVAWYKLPGLYRRDKPDWQRRNGGYVYGTYFDLVRAYLFKVKEPVVHPDTAGPDDSKR